MYVAHTEVCVFVCVCRVCICMQEYVHMYIMPVKATEEQWASLSVVLTQGLLRN